MRKILFALFVSFYTLSGFSQSDVIINTVTKQIAEGKYNDAERYLDSILKVEPKNIDALMMQGNVMLNYELVKSADIDVITPADESIFVQDIPSAKSPVVVVPKATALKIEKLWKQCLEIDGGRLDIRKGLCSLYGMAKMHDELVAYLPVVARWAKDKGSDFAFTLSDYATLLDARGDKDGAYMVYRKVAELYPGVYSIWCQLAATCYNNGDIAQAKLSLDKAMTVTKPDVAGCGDALDIYTATGQPDKVLKSLQIAGKDAMFNDYAFHSAIYKYAMHDKSWKQDMQAYVASYKTSEDSNALYMAARFMASDAFKENYKGYNDLLKFNLNDFSIQLIAERATKDFKDSVQPVLIYGQILINCKNYPKAVQVLKTIDGRAKGDARLDQLLLSAYALYRTRDYNGAIAKWTLAGKEKIPFFKATSNYFLGASYLKLGNVEKAKTYFKALVDSKDDSKFGYLASQQLKKLTVK